MSQKVWFLFYNDGYEITMCKIPKFYDGKIYFYIEDYNGFWSSVEDVGNANKFKPLDSKLTVEPATLIEICDAKLYKYITQIEVVEGQGKLCKSKRIDLYNL